MLKVDTIKNNSFSNSNIQYAKNSNSFGHKQVAQQAYMKMNKDVYIDYVAGDISLIQLLANKLKNLANVLAKNDPRLEIKAQIIEENLKREAQRKLSYRAIA